MFGRFSPNIPGVDQDTFLGKKIGPRSCLQSSSCVGLNFRVAMAPEKVILYSIIPLAHALTFLIWLDFCWLLGLLLGNRQFGCLSAKIGVELSCLCGRHIVPNTTDCVLICVFPRQRKAEPEGDVRSLDVAVPRHGLYAYSC